MRLRPVFAADAPAGSAPTGYLLDELPRAQAALVSLDADTGATIRAKSLDATSAGVARQAELRQTASDDGFVEDSMGAKLMADPYGVRDQKRYLLRNPIAAGNKWTNVVSVSSVETYEILAVGQPCEAPGGHWENCVIVESRNRVKEGTTLVNEVTFAPGVGIVKLATVLEAGERQIPQSTLSLLKFTPAN